MEVYFSMHAIRRMEERGISEEEVRVVIEDPERLRKQHDTFIALKIRQNGHLLIVVYKELVNIKNVITVISTSKVQKYL